MTMTPNQVQELQYKCEQCIAYNNKLRQWKQIDGALQTVANAPLSLYNKRREKLQQLLNGEGPDEFLRRYHDAYDNQEFSLDQEKLKKKLWEDYLASLDNTDELKALKAEFDRQFDANKVELARLGIAKKEDLLYQQDYNFYNDTQDSAAALANAVDLIGNIAQAQPPLDNKAILTIQKLILSAVGVAQTPEEKSPVIQRLIEAAIPHNLTPEQAVAQKKALIEAVASDPGAVLDDKIAIFQALILPATATVAQKKVGALQFIPEAIKALEPAAQKVAVAVKLTLAAITVPEHEDRTKAAAELILATIGALPAEQKQAAIQQLSAAAILALTPLANQDPERTETRSALIKAIAGAGAPEVLIGDKPAILQALILPANAIDDQKIAQARRFIPEAISELVPADKKPEVAARLILATITALTPQKDKSAVADQLITSAIRGISGTDQVADQATAKSELLKAVAGDLEAPINDKIVVLRKLCPVPELNEQKPAAIQPIKDAIDALPDQQRKDVAEKLLLGIMTDEEEEEEKLLLAKRLILTVNSSEQLTPTEKTAIYKKLIAQAVTAEERRELAQYSLGLENNDLTDHQKADIIGLQKDEDKIAVANNLFGKRDNVAGPIEKQQANIIANLKPDEKIAVRGKLVTAAQAKPVKDALVKCQEAKNKLADLEKKESKTDSEKAAIDEAKKELKTAKDNLNNLMTPLSLPEQSFTDVDSVFHALWCHDAAELQEISDLPVPGGKIKEEADFKKLTFKNKQAVLKQIDNHFKNIINPAKTVEAAAGGNGQQAEQNVQAEENEKLAMAIVGRAIIANNLVDASKIDDEDYIEGCLPGKIANKDIDNIHKQLNEEIKQLRAKYFKDHATTPKYPEPDELKKEIAECVKKSLEACGFVQVRDSNNNPVSGVYCCRNEKDKNTYILVGNEKDLVPQIEAIVDNNRKFKDNNGKQVKMGYCGFTKLTDEEQQVAMKECLKLNSQFGFDGKEHPYSKALQKVNDDLGAVNIFEMLDKTIPAPAFKAHWMSTGAITQAGSIKKFLQLSAENKQVVAAVERGVKSYVDELLRGDGPSRVAEDNLSVNKDYQRKIEKVLDKLDAVPEYAAQCQQLKDAFAPFKQKIEQLKAEIKERKLAAAADLFAGMQ